MLSRASLNGFKPWSLPNECFGDLRELIMLDCNTGLRASEALTLEFADVDWERRVVRVRNKPHLDFHVKNYQERHIRLNSHAYTALMLAKEHPQSDFVFHRKDGSRWTDIHESFNAVVRWCGGAAVRLTGRSALQHYPPHTPAHLRLMAHDHWCSIARDPKTDESQLNCDHRKVRSPEREPHHGGVKTGGTFTKFITRQ